MGVSEEEETRGLLEESPAHQGLEQRRASVNQVRPANQGEVPRPRPGWELPQWEGQVPHREGQVLHSSWEGQLSVGAAEKTFFAMNGALAAASKRGKEDSDTNTTVPDSIEVVKEILNEIELETEVRMSSSNYDTCSEEGLSSASSKDVSSSQVVSGSQDVSSSQGMSGSQVVSNSQVVSSSQSASLDDTASSCTLCDSQDQARPTTSLVVDVHMEQEVRCSKHTLDRFPRSYSESSKTRQREELANLDKIETVCEPDRLRHFSESSVARRTRANTLSDELRQFKRSFLASRSGEVAETDTAAQHRSTTSSSSNVKFDIFDEGGSGSECEEVVSQPHLPPHPLVASLRSAPTMSTSSSTTSMPICRICQLPSLEPNNQLISPCRCLGSIRYVHNPCLLKWLEVSSKKHTGPPCCELCQYQYLRHKKFVVSHCLFPSCSARDKILHFVFVVAIALMITCAAVTILCFKQDRGNRPKVAGPNTELSPSELMTLSCGVLFFLAFFIAMYVEVKAKNTIYQLICKFFYMNHEWSIEEYDRRRDPAKQLESP